jgi:hypothetical protein
MSAIRFVPFNGIAVTAGWLESPGRYFLSVYKGRNECIFVTTETVKDLEASFEKAGVNKRVPGGFWRYLERREGAVFYWWEHGQWMRLDENVARVMRGRAGRYGI